MSEIEVTAGVVPFEDGTRYTIARKDIDDPSSPIVIVRFSKEGRQRLQAQPENLAQAREAIALDRQNRTQERVEFRLGELEDGTWIIQARREPLRQKLARGPVESNPWSDFGEGRNRKEVVDLLPSDAVQVETSYGPDPGYEIWSHRAATGAPERGGR